MLGVVLALSVTLARGLLHSSDRGGPSGSQSDGTAAVPTHEYLSGDSYASLRAPDYTDVTYKKIGGHQLKLDIYLPDKKQEGGSPAVIYMHPGSWTEGTKAQIHANPRKLLSNGVALVAIDYRLTTESDTWGGEQVTWPAQGEDVADAARWLRDEGSSYGVDPQRVGCWGDSAGGQLCAWLATVGATNNERLLNVAVIMFAPTCFLCDPYTDELLGNFPADWYFGFQGGRLATLKENEANPGNAEASDIALVQTSEATYNLLTISESQATSASIAPIFIGQGDADTLVPPVKAGYLASALSNANVNHKLAMVPNGGHEYANWSDEPIDEAISFIKQYI